MDSVRNFQRWGRRALDITVSGLALPFAAPVIGAAALVNKILEPNEPPFYVTKRLGEGGKEITLVKIRSMRSDSNGERPVDKIEGSRINDFGRFMRRYAVDELPQLWSVLKGDLRLFGPRAIPQWDVENVARAILEDPTVTEDKQELFAGWQRSYFAEPPGLFGLAQMAGNRNLSAYQRILYDLCQSSQGMGFDVKMLFHLPQVLIRGRGLR